MLFSYNWLQSHFKKPLPKPDKLAEVLTMHSFEVEDPKELKTQNSKLKTDWLLDIDVLPNRGHDCLCHFGIAREIAAITGAKLKYPETAELKEAKGRISPIKLKIQCPQLVPRYSAIVVEGVRIGKSPEWIKERLEAAGIRSINNIIDLTNFVMLETGQPLHAFDFDKIKSVNSKLQNYKEMIVRMARQGEKLQTLDDKIHKLEGAAIVIESGGKLIDLVGIMGGKLSEVSSKTKNIILQAGNFDRRSIYNTTKRLGHFTDASNIYGQGIGPNITMPALERAYFLLGKLGGGKIVQVIDVYPKKVLPKIIKLDLNYVEKLLGIKIPEMEIRKILDRLGLEIKNCKLKILNVGIPTFRLDISLPEDLIEEIGRIYGFQKIPADFPVASLIPPKRNFEIFWEDTTKNILKELGFTEIYNYSFISPKQVSTFEFQSPDLIKVKNPVSAEQEYLRPSLIPNLLNNVKNNFKYFDSIRIFELGKIFRREKKTRNEEKILEKRMIGGAIAGEQKFNLFSQVKGGTDSLLNGLGISNIWYDEFQPTPEEGKITIWHPKKCAEIKVDSEEIGFLGEVSPKILKKLEINGNIVLFELDFEKLTKLCSEEHEYQPISSYPAAVRDLAILVPRETKVAEVLNKISAAGGPLIRDIDIFDIYEGEEIPSGKKNLAFHIIYQAEDRTLNAREIDGVQNKIIKALEKELEWEVRK